ncbi:hypothetical protein, variant [Capsaspora owczarzaki ATCC 30864]|nr:hypothetical protein, variant [Capsaspora owczarzaki ATCC 30864]
MVAFRATCALMRTTRVEVLDTVDFVEKVQQNIASEDSHAQLFGLLLLELVLYDRHIRESFFVGSEMFSTVMTRIKEQAVTFSRDRADALSAASTPNVPRASTSERGVTAAVSSSLPNSSSIFAQAAAEAAASSSSSAPPNALELPVASPRAPRSPRIPHPRVGGALNAASAAVPFEPAWLTRLKGQQQQGSPARASGLSGLAPPALSAAASSSAALPEFTNQRMLLALLGCFAALAEYQESVEAASAVNVLETLLVLLHTGRNNKYVVNALLAALAAFLLHKKFATEFIECGGLQLLLELPREVFTAMHLSACFVILSRNVAIMERMCLMPNSTLAHVIDSILWILDCTSEETKARAVLFFVEAFCCRAVVEYFDSRHGLRILVNLIGMLELQLDSPESEQLLALNTCCALRQYFRMHLSIKAYAVRRKIALDQVLGLGPPAGPSTEARFGSPAVAIPTVGGGTASRPADGSTHSAASMPATLLPAYKSTVLDAATTAQDAELVSNNLNLAFSTLVDLWAPVDELLRMTAIEHFYELIDMGASWFDSQVMEASLDILQVCAVLPSSHVQLIATTFDSHVEEATISGMELLLLTAEGKRGEASSAVRKAALSILCSCVCRASLTQRQMQSMFTLSPPFGMPPAPGIPQLQLTFTAPIPPVHCIRTTYSCIQSYRNNPPPMLTLYSPPAPLDLLLQIVFDTLRGMSGIKVLLSLLRLVPHTRTPLADADVIRALACRALVGVARDGEILQLLSRLQLTTELSEMMREPVNPATSAMAHASFRQLAASLVATLTGRNALAIRNEVANNSLQQLDRAAIVASTEVSYSDDELMVLIFNHLQSKGLTSSAEALRREARLQTGPGALGHAGADAGRAGIPANVRSNSNAGGAVAADAMLSLETTPSVSRSASYIAAGAGGEPSSMSLAVNSHAAATFGKVFAEISGTSVSESINNSAGALTNAPAATPVSLRTPLTLQRMTPTTRLRSTPLHLSHATKPLAVTDAHAPYATTTVVASHSAGSAASSSLGSDGTAPASHVHVHGGSVASGQPSAPSLDIIIKQFLRDQHENCSHPIAVAPPFSLMTPHHCPEPTHKHYAPTNMATRMLARQIQPSDGGLYGRKLSRKFLFSRLRKVETCRPLRTIRSLCYADDGESVILGDEFGEISMLNLHTMEEAEQSFGNSTGAILALRPSKDSRLILASSQYGPVRSTLWRRDRLGANEHHLTVALEFEDDWFAQFSGDNTQIIGTEDSTARIYSAETGQVILTLSDAASNRYERNVACFNATDDLVLHDGVLWDARQARKIHKFDKFNNYGLSRFHPNGNEILINSEIWDVRTFKLLRTCPMLDRASVIFSSTSDVIFAIAHYQPSISIVKPRTPRNTLHTIDATDYSTISSLELSSPILDISLHPHDTSLILSEKTPSGPALSLYDIGRHAASDSDREDASDMDEDDPDNDAENSDDDDDDDEENGSETELDVSSLDLSDAPFDLELSGFDFDDARDDDDGDEDDGDDPDDDDDDDENDATLLGIDQDDRTRWNRRGARFGGFDESDASSEAVVDTEMPYSDHSDVDHDHDLESGDFDQAAGFARAVASSDDDSHDELGRAPGVRRLPAGQSREIASNSSEWESDTDDQQLVSFGRGSRRQSNATVPVRRTSQSRLGRRTRSRMVAASSGGLVVTPTSPTRIPATSSTAASGEWEVNPDRVNAPQSPEAQLDIPSSPTSNGGTSSVPATRRSPAQARRQRRSQDRIARVRSQRAAANPSIPQEFMSTVGNWTVVRQHPAATLVSAAPAQARRESADAGAESGSVQSGTSGNELPSLDMDSPDSDVSELEFETGSSDSSGMFPDDWGRHRGSRSPTRSGSHHNNHSNTNRNDGNDDDDDDQDDDNNDDGDNEHSDVESSSLNL